MTEPTVASAAADAVAHPSQIIHDSATHESPRAGSLPEADAPKEAPKPISTRDAIAKAFDDATKASEADKAAAAKPEDVKAKPEAQPKADKARDDAGKFAKAEQTAEPQVDAKAEKGAPQKGAVQEVPERRQSEGRHPEPPARFLPEARAKWANVPNEVKAEFHRVSQEMEGEISRTKDVADRYERIREFDDIARANGRELKDTLAKVVEIENAMARNPIAGLDAVIRSIDMRKSDGSPVTLYEVAQMVVANGPQAYYQPAQQPQTQQPAPQANPEIEALRAEVLSLRAEQTVVPVIEAFAGAHPDFTALQGEIEQILTSGIIERLRGNGLSSEQKLSEAYRMAGGRVPPSRPDTESAPAHSEAIPTARPVDPDGQKSIKGAPTAGQTGEPKWVPKSNREALERAFANAR